MIADLSDGIILAGISQLVSGVIGTGLGGLAQPFSENVQAQFLDMNMVHEPKEAVRILQRAINAATPIPSVSVDGIMRKGVASAATRTIAKDVNILKAERCLFYAEEIRRKPNQKQFWVRRFTRAISLG